MAGEDIRIGPKGHGGLRWLGTRDPSCVFDIFQVIGVFGASAYALFGMASALGIHCPPSTMLIAFTAVVAPAVVNRAADSLGHTMAHGAPAARSPYILGHPSEIARVRGLANLVAPDRERFAGALSRGQQYALFGTVVMVLPVLRVFAHVESRSLSLIAFGTIVAVALEYLYTRCVYSFSGSAMVVERYHWLRVHDGARIPLSGAEVLCDFGAETVQIRRGDSSVTVCLGELWRPHRFVACVLAAAGGAKTGAIQGEVDKPEDQLML